MEREWIEWLRERLPPHPLLKLGIGDDTAVLSLGGDRDALVTTDIITDQIDFRLDECTPQQIGRKALAVNLSDIAAMAGEPLAAVVGLILPRGGALTLSQGLYEGMLPLAEEFGVAIAGGDTNSWDGPLAVSITLLGRVGAHGVLRRDGARPGDKIIVTGEFGGSILGHHFTLTPRVRESLLIKERYSLSAGMDCSDGLSLDLSRLAAASGCGACLDRKLVPVSQAAEQLSQQDGVSSVDHALADGEDFELILAVPESAATAMLDEQPLLEPHGVRLTCIGEFIREPGLWELDERGQRRALLPRGYLHT